MTQLVVVGEDALCCALGQRLVAHALPGWSLAVPPIDTRGVTNLLPKLARYINMARHGPSVFCLADSDQVCPVDLLKKWLAHAPPTGFVLRLAVREAESWVLADGQGMRDHFRVPLPKLPHQPDELVDPKRDLLKFLSRYAPAQLRREMVQASPTQLSMGTGYNAGLRDFVSVTWRPDRAADQSPSLRRALVRLAVLAGGTRV